MGAVISAVQSAFLIVSAIISALSDLNSKYQSLLRRINAPPGIPVANPTDSYWLDDPPFPELVDRQDDLPAEADIVIIGSGITAAAAAKTILELTAAEEPTIVVLEARQVCSGATGRNGGHIKCDVYDAFASRKKWLGPERGRDVVRMQLRHLPMLLELGAAIPQAEVREVEAVDLFLDEAPLGRVKAELEDVRAWLPELKIEVSDGEAARERFGVNEKIVGAISYKAGALFPYRLVTGVWNDLLEKYLNLLISTHTAVNSITKDTSSPYPYQLHTSKKPLRARHVLHATNGFAPQLLPSLRGKLTGLRVHMEAQKPGSSFPAFHGRRSWSLIYQENHFDYVVQRPDQMDGTPGDLMVGGGFFRSQGAGLDQIGVWDDSKTDTFTQMHLRGYLPTVFDPNWGRDGELKKAWVGIMGLTGDTLPLVGRIPHSQHPSGGLQVPGEWISAGYNGDGMIWAWLCGTAVGIMMLGKEATELAPGVGRPGGKLKEWFPVEELKVDEARLRRADLTNLMNEL